VSTLLGKAQIVIFYPAPESDFSDFRKTCEAPIRLIPPDAT
jgi:hypothetical protein